MNDDPSRISRVPAEPDADQALLDLRRALERERARTRALEASLRLQGLRGDGLQAGLDQTRHTLHQIEHSKAWRLTRSLRYARGLAAGRLPTGHGLREAGTAVTTILRDEGATAALRQSWQFLRPLIPTVPRALRSLPRRRADAPARPGAPPSSDESLSADPYNSACPASLGSLAPQILLVAELSVPQCAKYRVWQKQEMLRALGHRCEVVSWRDIDRVFTALQLATEAVFYRVPAEPVVLAMIREARRLGLSPRWEVDDLIFDPVLYRLNSNLATLEPALRREVLRGSALYRQAMLACGRAIASTPVLAESMRTAGIGDVVVIENALDRETLQAAAELRERRRRMLDARPAGNPVLIVYGSGTKTHDADFAVAAPAILALLRRHPHARLRIIGDLTLPPEYATLGDQVEELAGTDYRGYLALMAEADIAIAPLEPSVFNDAKSNIKFQEAAILGLPSVCSPAATFRDVVRHGENGFLANDESAWNTALETLLLDSGLRDRVGEQSRRDVLARYAPDRIAADQVAAVFGSPPAAPAIASVRPLRVLSVNIFFAPQSFGGATIVAEEMATRLATGGVELAVFTSRPHLDGRPNSLLRFEMNGLPILATSLSPSSDQVVQLDNPGITEIFARVLDAVRPDVVHAHSIQGFGASILGACRDRGVPYVLTLHDAWWLCDRQFMVKGNGRYCFQERIDLRVCQNCLPGARHLGERAEIMAAGLAGAALLLSPSRSHRALYLANGIEPERIRVNRNGVRRPSRPRSPRPQGVPMRFGFVGGNEAIKGFPLIRDAFESLGRADWELVLVDNTLNLGFRSIDVSEWEVSGRITVLPAYTQDGIDDFFDRIDVLLFPSQWKESYGLTVREALIRDVWVIATGPGGQSEDIHDGVNGTLIPLDGRAASLRAAVRDRLADPGWLDGYRNPYGAELASWDDQAADLLAVLREVALATGTAGEEISGGATPGSPHHDPR